MIAFTGRALFVFIALQISIGGTTSHWQTIKYNNTFIHLVRENLTQENAISGCKRWFNGTLLHLSDPEEVFQVLRKVYMDGDYWIEDIKDPDMTDDCLVFTRRTRRYSVCALHCEAEIYSLCQSIDDPSLFLNNDFFESILDDLVLKNNETAKDFRAKNSVWDDRLSAHIVGGSGIVFMVIFCVIIGLCDLPYLKYCIRLIADKFIDQETLE